MSDKAESIPVRADLPFPRLELVYSPLANHPDGFTGQWTYRLCLQHVEAHVHALDLSHTLTATDLPAGPLLPFRAALHMQYDRAHLNVQAVVLRTPDGEAEPLPPADPDWLAAVQADNALRLCEGLATGPLTDAEANALLMGGLPAGEEHRRVA